MRKLLLTSSLLIAITTFAQPANDEPCGAVEMVISNTCVTVSGSDVGATGTLGIPPPGCGNYLGHDVWFRLVAPLSGIAEFTMTEASFNDGAMALYSADSCEGGMILIACDDDEGPGLLPRIFRDDLVPGQVYFIRAFGYSTSTGTFEICGVGPSTLPEGDCVYQLELFDSGGNGWEGASLSVSVNSGAPMNYTCQTSYATYLIGLDVGDVLTITYTAGLNNNQNKYDLRSGIGGTVAFSDGPLPAEGLVYTLVNSCSPILSGPVDCAYRLPICADTTFAQIIPDPGSAVDLDPTNRGCLSAGESGGTWIELEFASSGTLGFMIAPNSIAEFDFALWGPFSDVVCPLPDAPVRCSFSAVSGTTGLLASVTDQSEGAAGDSFVDTLHVLEGERYVLFIDNFSRNGIGFNLSFQLSDGASLACSTAPIADFIASANEVLVNEPVNFTDLSTGLPFAWLWLFPGANTQVSNEQDPADIDYAIPGCYDVTLTSFNAIGDGTASRSCEINVLLSTGINDHEEHDPRVSVANGMLMINTSGFSGRWNWTLADANGRLVMAGSAFGERTTQRLVETPNGVYALSMFDSTTLRSVRLLIAK